MGINTQIVTNFVATQMSEFFAQMNPILMTANRKYQKQNEISGYATGGVFNIKIPGYFNVSTGLSTSAEGITDLVTPYQITPNDFYSVNLALDVFEEIFNMVGGRNALTDPAKDAIVDNYARPAFLAISAKMETVAAYRLKVNSSLSPIDTVQALGSVNTASTINNLTAAANLFKFDASGRTLMMNTLDYTSVANSLNNSFATGVAKQILESGQWQATSFAGNAIFASPDIGPHIAGACRSDVYTTAITVTNIDATGTLLTLAGVPASSGVVIKAGDKISIPSVYRSQNISKTQLPYKLVVTAAQDANGDGAGNVQVTIDFPLIASGQHINVISLPANGAPAYVFPSYNPNYLYVKSGLSNIMLMPTDIAGAINSQTKTDFGCPVKTYVQGLVGNLTNAFRIQTIQAVKVISPYVLCLPSIAPGL